MPALSPDNLPEGTITFLFTDVEASTRLWEQFPDTMQTALARHDALLSDCVEAQGGHLFKRLGDGFHAAFATVEAGLAAALAAQIALHAQSWELPEDTLLRVRMALHTGQAEQRGGDYFGLSLNRAARLLAAAHGGQTLVSENSAALLADTLPPDAALRSLGKHRLKDLAQPQGIFQLLHPKLPSDFPPPRSLEAFIHNLPLQLSSFVGREAEIQQAKQLLTENRLLTLTGTGGAGKTRLALQAAAEVIERFEHGVWIVELAPLNDGGLIEQEIAATLGLREEGEKTLRQTLTDALRPKSLLLILDNCEHLIDACAHLAETLLRTCPNLRLLTTSREALAIDGEALLPLSSLSLPDDSEEAETETLAQCEAIRLFIDRATTALPTFRFSAGNAQAVAQVCARLDGLPLALELAAARVKVLSPQQIAERLDDRFRLLSGGSRTALPRQQTLRALIDWSYDLLAPTEQTLLRRLSVFSGGWSLEGAEAVCSGGSVDEWEVLDLLSRLVAKSLVVVEPPSEGQVRYHLLDNIGRYAGERLAETEEAKTLPGRHRDWFLHLVEEAEPNLSGPSHGHWLNRLECDHDNFRAALRFTQPESPEVLLRLAGALSRFWHGRCYLREGRGWLEMALRLGPSAPDSARVKALHGLGLLSYACGDYTASQANHAQDLALRRTLQDTRGIARALSNLGIIAAEQEDFASAQTMFADSLEQYRLLNDEVSAAHMLQNLGGIAVLQQDYAPAEALLQEALGLYRHLQDQLGAASALHNLGDLFLRQGRLEQAKPYFRDSLAAQKMVGNTQRIASTLTHLGEIAGIEGDNESACLLFGAADSILGSGHVPANPQDIHYRPTLDTVRCALDSERFQFLWSKVHQWSSEQAIAYVLDNYVGNKKQ
jgi:predicted ATPase/class 3 adenylate cyclase/Tfp pilus assembly protein PilF